MSVLDEVGVERLRQNLLHGDQSHLLDGTGPALTSPGSTMGPASRHDLVQRMRHRADAASRSQGDGTITFEHILTEEWAEVIAESDPTALRAELIQVAAVAVQWVEAIDRRGGAS